MARVTRYIDDLTGKEIPDGDGGPVVFSLNGDFYEIDLSSDTRAKLEKALKPYIDVATPVEPPSPEPTRRRQRATARPAVTTAAENRAFLSAVRAWAREKGYDVSDRGRVAADIVAAYEAAH